MGNPTINRHPEQYINVSDLKSSIDDDVAGDFKPTQAPIFDIKHTPGKHLRLIKLNPTA